MSGGQVGTADPYMKPGYLWWGSPVYFITTSLSSLSLLIFILKAGVGAVDTKYHKLLEGRFLQIAGTEGKLN